jgi:hypothetical protein
MIGVIGWTPADVWPLTMREFIQAHDAVLVSKWDHTASNVSMVHNLIVTVNNALYKKKQRPKSLIDFHPYRSSTESRHGVITPDNFELLERVGEAML